MVKTEVHNNIKFLALFNFLLSFRFYYPVLIIYFVRVTGSYALGASIFSIAMISAAIFELPTGIFSDRIGRKKTLIIGAVSTLISGVFYALGGSYLILALGAIIQGLAGSLYSGNNQALLHDTLAESNEEGEYAKYYGKTGSAQQLGLAIAAIAGGILAYWSFPLVMWLSVIPAIAGVFVSLKIVEPNFRGSESGNVYSHLGEAFRNFKKNKKLRMLSISSIIGFAQGESGFQFRSAFIEMLWPVWAIGIAQALSNVGATVSFYYSGKFVKRLTALKTLIGGKIYSIISNTLAFAFPTAASPIIMSSNSLFFGTGSVASSTLMQKEYTDQQRSTMESLNSLGKSVGFAVVSFVLGLVADALNPAKALLSLQVLAAVSLLILWIMFRKEKGPNQ